MKIAHALMAAALLLPLSARAGPDDARPPVDPKRVQYMQEYWDSGGNAASGMRLCRYLGIADNANAVNCYLFLGLILQGPRP